MRLVVGTELYFMKGTTIYTLKPDYWLGLGLNVATGRTAHKRTFSSLPPRIEGFRDTFTKVKGGQWSTLWMGACQ